MSRHLDDALAAIDAALGDCGHDEVQSIGDWQTNADLMVDVARLGWISDDLSVFDATYGLGRFWTHYQPKRFVGADINPDKSPCGCSIDFRKTGLADRSFDVVVFDPPYKLSGTPALGDFDHAYGIDVPQRWQDRMQLIADGVAECARIAAKHLLVKCQDQVVSGKMRWQTDVVTEVAYAAGFRKADRFDFRGSGGQKQPSGRRQVHARHSVSQLLVFTRGEQDNGVQTSAAPLPAADLSAAGAGWLPAPIDPSGQDGSANPASLPVPAADTTDTTKGETR